MSPGIGFSYYYSSVGEGENKRGNGHKRDGQDHVEGMSIEKHRFENVEKQLIHRTPNVSYLSRGASRKLVDL